MSKTYILQKDLPDYKANERFTLEDDGIYYKAETPCKDGVYGRWPPEYVENNPTWFLPAKFEIKYTEQDMRECFRNSRRKSTLQSPWQTGEFSWLSFDHYMSFVKQPKYKIPPLE